MIISCDHCQKDIYITEAVTLAGLAGGHSHEEHVSICKSCAWTSNYLPAYWVGWLDSFFGRPLEDF